MIMSVPLNQPKLSLVAQCDDIINHMDSLVIRETSGSTEIFEKMEDLRVRCMMTEWQLDYANGLIVSALKEIQRYNTTIRTDTCGSIGKDARKT